MVPPEKVQFFFNAIALNGLQAKQNVDEKTKICIVIHVNVH